MIYTVFILLTFLVLKIINFRLHKALDLEPTADEEEEEEAGEDRQSSSEGDHVIEEEGEKEMPREERRGGEEEDRERKELSEDAEFVDATEAKREETAMVLPGQASAELTEEEEVAKLKDAEDSLQKHRDSASTLGQSSNYQSSPEEPTELTAVAVAEETQRGGGRARETAAESLLVMIDAEVEGRREKKNRPSDARAEDELEYHTPSKVPVGAGSGTEPGLKPINEEAKSSEQK